MAPAAPCQIYCAMHAPFQSWVETAPSQPISISPDAGDSDAEGEEGTELYAFSPFSAKESPPPRQQKPPVATLRLPRWLNRRASSSPTLSPVQSVGSAGHVTPLDSPVPIGNQPSATPVNSPPMLFQLQRTPERGSKASPVPRSRVPDVEPTPPFAHAMAERLSDEQAAAAPEVAKPLFMVDPLANHGAGELTTLPRCPCRRSSTSTSPPEAWKVLPRDDGPDARAEMSPRKLPPPSLPHAVPPLPVELFDEPTRQKILTPQDLSSSPHSILGHLRRELSATSCILDSSPHPQPEMPVPAAAAPWTCFVESVHSLLGCEVA